MTDFPSKFSVALTDQSSELFWRQRGPNRDSTHCAAASTYSRVHCQSNLFDSETGLLFGSLSYISSDKGLRGLLRAAVRAPNTPRGRPILAEAGFYTAKHTSRDGFGVRGERHSQNRTADLAVAKRARDVAATAREPTMSSPPAPWGGRAMSPAPSPPPPPNAPKRIL